MPRDSRSGDSEVERFVIHDDNWLMVRVEIARIWRLADSHWTMGPHFPFYVKEIAEARRCSRARGERRWRNNDVKADWNDLDRPRWASRLFLFLFHARDKRLKTVRPLYVPLIHVHIARMYDSLSLSMNYWKE